MTRLDRDALLLRPLRDTDADRWWELAHDPAQVHLGTPSFVPLPDSPADLRMRAEDEQAKWAAGDPATAAVVAGDEPERMLGTVSWRADVPLVMGVADTGYAVHPDSRGRGVATGALRAMVEHLRARGDLARVQLDHSVENPASCRVAQAAGLPVEGRREGYLPLRDPAAPDGVRRHDVCLHGVLLSRLTPASLTDRARPAP